VQKPHTNRNRALSLCARCSRPSRLSPPALWVKHDGQQSAVTMTMTGCLQLRVRLEHVKVWRFRSLQYGEALGSLSCNKSSGRPQSRKRNLLRLHKKEKKNYKTAAHRDQSLAHEFHAQAPLATALHLLRALVAPALSAASSESNAMSPSPAGAARNLDVLLPNIMLQYD
jgi:hypothetical protein